MNEELNKNAIKLAADACGGFPQLAAKLGVSRHALYQWDIVPADRVIEVELVSGVSRAVLRPDLYEGFAPIGTPEAAA